MFSFRRNRRSASIGIRVQHGPERAPNVDSGVTPTQGVVLISEGRVSCDRCRHVILTAEDGPAERYLTLTVPGKAGGDPIRIPPRRPIPMTSSSRMDAALSMPEITTTCSVPTPAVLW